jgi:hypothetical protein
VTDIFWGISIGDIVGEWGWHYLFVDGDLGGCMSGGQGDDFFLAFLFTWFHMNGVATVGVDIGGIDYVIGGSDWLRRVVIDWEEMREAIVIPPFVTIILRFPFITSRLSEYGSILKSS